MNTFNVKLDIIPPKATHQASQCILKNKKTGKQFIGKKSSSKGKQTERLLISELSKYAPETPISDPVCLNVQWVYPYLQSRPKSKCNGLVPCITRPDVDNLQKLLLDAMVKSGYFTDDSIVFNIIFMKCYNKTHGIFLNITY